MRILGVDPGYAHCGWAVVDGGEVIALGVIVTAKRTADIATDRLQRLADVATLLEVRAREHRCEKICAEEPLQHGASAAIAANLLPWGGLTMLATVLGIPLVMVRAKTWQHAVLDTEKGKVDYDEVERKLEEFAGYQVGDWLRDIKKKYRTHALDACGVGLLASLRPHLTTQIVARRARA